MNPIQIKVKRQQTPQEKYAQLCLATVCFLLFLTLFELSSKMGYFAIIGWVGGFAVVYFIYKYTTKYVIDYLYELDHDQLKIVQIVSRKNTSDLIQVDVKSFEKYEPYDHEQHEEFMYDTTIYACESKSHPSNKAASFVDENGQNILLVITTTPEFDRAIKGEPEPIAQNEPEEP